jgi:hypothetical protein
MGSVLEDLADALGIEFSFSGGSAALTSASICKPEERNAAILLPCDDLVKMFCGMRERHMTFSRISCSPTPAISSRRPCRGQVSGEGTAPAAEDSNRSFVECLMCISDPATVLCDELTRRQREQKMIDQMSLDIAIQAKHIVREFRSEYKPVHTSDELMALIYDPRNALHDCAINDLVFFYAATLYKVTIVVDYDDTCKTFPLSRSINDAAVLLKREVREESGLGGGRRPAFRVHIIEDSDVPKSTLLTVFKYLAKCRKLQMQGGGARGNCSVGKKSDLRRALAGVGVVSDKHVREILMTATFPEEPKRINKQHLADAVNILSNP